MAPPKPPSIGRHSLGSTQSQDRQPGMNNAADGFLYVWMANWPQRKKYEINRKLKEKLKKAKSTVFKLPNSAAASHRLTVVEAIFEESVENGEGQGLAVTQLDPWL